MDERANQSDGPNIDPSVANPAYIGTERAQKRAADRGGGDGGSGTLSLRVSHLESRIERIESKLDLISDRVGAIATRTETRNYLWLAIATFVAIVGVLIASMGWLETRASRLDTGSSSPQPIIIQLPTTPPSVSADDITRRSPPRRAEPRSPE